MMLLPAPDVFPEETVRAGLEVVRAASPSANPVLAAAVLVLPYDVIPGINISASGIKDSLPTITYRTRTFYSSASDVLSLARNLWLETRVVRTGTTIGELAGFAQSGASNVVSVLPWFGVDVSSISAAQVVPTQDLVILTDALVETLAHDPTISTLTIDVGYRLSTLTRKPGFTQWSVKTVTVVSESGAEPDLFGKLSRVEEFLRTNLPLRGATFSPDAMGETQFVASYSGMLANGETITVPVSVGASRAYWIGPRVSTYSTAPHAAPAGFRLVGQDPEGRVVVEHTESHIRALLAS